MDYTIQSNCKNTHAMEEKIRRILYLILIKIKTKTFKGSENILGVDLNDSLCDQKDQMICVIQQVAGWITRAFS